MKMDQKEILLNEITELTTNMKQIDNALKLKQAELAESCCPYKVGQMFVSVRESGYGSKKKMRTYRARLVSIGFLFNKPHYELGGIYIKKDGSDSANGVTRLYDFENWVPFEPDK
jgi:hypothetical protein